MIDADRRAIEAYWKASHSMKTPQAAKNTAKNTLKAALSEDVTKPEVILPVA